MPLIVFICEVNCQENGRMHAKKHFLISCDISEFLNIKNLINSPVDWVAAVVVAVEADDRKKVFAARSVCSLRPQLRQLRPSNS